MRSALIWLRRDLRLADNAALHAARQAGFAPILVYIDAPDEEAPWQPGAATRWWLHHSLAALQAQVKTLGGELVLRRGSSASELRQLLNESGAQAVYWNRLYDPAITQRDASIKAELRASGIHAESCAGHLIAEPWEIRNGSDQPYRVFTPFWKTLRQRFPLPAPLPGPTDLPAHALRGLHLDELQLLPKIAWDLGFRKEWVPGEAGALDMLDTFIESALESYAGGRDLPDRRGTSRLSPHLHFGEISPRQISQRLLQNTAPAQRELAEPYLRELGWRDFGHHLLFHFPNTTVEPLQSGFSQFSWAEVDANKLRAWQTGQTGIPIVDAGMRELWMTGWMHNRVRMIVASLLTKNLRYHWLHGARWFWDTLVDADLANNTQGWQWTAGSGADAAPYFRIFNPVTQGERFDPLGTYVRRYVPELAQLPPKYVHQPWMMGGVRAYPKPIVDLKLSRAAALAAYSDLRGKA